MSDEKGNYCDFNQRWLRFRGRSLEDEVDRGWMDGIHPDDREKYLRVFNEALYSKTFFETECRLKRFDDEYRCMLVKGQPEYTNGRFVGFVGTCIDITGRMLQPGRSGQRANLADEANAIAHVGGWEYDISAHRIKWTSELYRIVGLRDGTPVTIEQICTYFSEEHQDELRRHFEAAVARGQHFNLELKGTTADQREVWVNMRAKVLYDNDRATRIIGSVQDITQQKKADHALVESERMLSFVLDGLPVGVYLTDASGYITNYNKSATDLWGAVVVKDKVKWSGSHKLYSASGVFISNEECPMAIAIKNNKIIYGEELISECKEGTRTNVIVFATPYTDVNGAVMGALNVLVDITERKQLEEKLTSLSLVARKTSNAVIISDASGRITWVNQSFTKMSGYTMAEAIGKTPQELLHCEETDKHTVADVLQAFEKRQPVRFEILNKGKHGNKYWLDVDIQPLFDYNGNLSGFVSVETDITELKYIHEALKKSENKLRAILDSTSDDNILVDPDYKIISINKVATQNLKKVYGVEPAVGQLIWDFVNEEMRDEFEQIFNQAIAGFMNKKERQFKVKNDIKLWFEFCFYPVYANDDALIGVVINSKNIHARKTAEIRVQRQNKKLKEIAFIQSHTLRRPVANIMGLWNLINQEARKAPMGNDLTELLQYLGRSVNEMDEVIRRITGNTYNMDEV